MNTIAVQVRGGETTSNALGTGCLLPVVDTKNNPSLAPHPHLLSHILYPVLFFSLILFERAEKNPGPEMTRYVDD